MTLKDFINLEHQCWYINWHEEATEIELNTLDFNKKLEEVRKTLTRVKTLDGGRTKRENFPPNSYDEYVPAKYRDKQYRIYCRIGNKYFIYKTHRFGKTINKEGCKSPYDAVVDRFRMRTGLGRDSMYNAFGTVEYEYRKCVPIPLCYFNPMYKSDSSIFMNKIEHISCIDGCSQYPTALCDKLPDAKTSKEVKGTVKPDSEYEFALYLKSGHVAVYNEFDTHAWETHTWGNIIYRHRNETVAPEDDVTILMKASKYTFKEEMEYFFNIKETYPKDSVDREEAKLVMNAFIGTMWMNNPVAYSKRKYAHLVAVAQARALQKMLNQLDRLHVLDVIHICVDGIIYQGTQVLGTVERKLGNFEQEILDAEMVIKEYNTYVIKKDNEVIKSKHGSYNTYLDGTPIVKLKDYKELFMLKRTDNSSDYDTIKDYREKKL